MSFSRPSSSKASEPSSLSEPLGYRRRGLRRPDPDTFGRVSEGVARYIGSWRFIAWMTAFIWFWVLWNIFAPQSWRPDEYPFIFLTLLLSLQASYAAPLILLAQNRQDDRDRVQFGEDRARTELLIAETDYVTRELASLRAGLGEVPTRDFLRSELKALLEALEEDDEASEQPSQP